MLIKFLSGAFAPVLIILGITLLFLLMTLPVWVAFLCTYPKNPPTYVGAIEIAYLMVLFGLLELQRV